MELKMQRNAWMRAGDTERKVGTIFFIKIFIFEELTETKCPHKLKVHPKKNVKTRYNQIA